MDVIDKAQHAHETHLSDDLARARAVAQHSPKPTGYCLNCGIRLEKRGQRWCDLDCRDDWEFWNEHCY